MEDRTYSSVVRVKKVRDELTCAVCLNYLRDPKLLDCAHSFCRNCLAGLLESPRAQRDNAISCPTCRNSTPLGTGGVDSLQNNFTVRSLVTIVSEEIKMEENQSQGACASEDTRVQRDEGGPASVPLKVEISLPNCTKHDLSQEYYCAECNELLCRSCMMDKHRLHNYDVTDVVFESMRISLSEMVQAAHESLSTAESVAKEVAHSKTDVIAKSDDVKAKINDYFVEVRKHVDKREASLLAAVDDYYAKQLQTISRRDNEVAEAVGTLRHSIETICKLIDGKNVMAIVTTGKSCAENLSAHQAKVSDSISVKECFKPSLSLAFQDQPLNIESICNELGKVAETAIDIKYPSDIQSQESSESIQPMDETGQGTFVTNPLSPTTSHPPIARKSSTPLFPTTPPLRVLSRSQTTNAVPVHVIQPVTVIPLNRSNESFHPCGIAVTSSSSSVVVSDVKSGTGCVKVVAGTGRVIDSIGIGRNGSVFRGPCALASDKDDIFILTSENQRIYRFSNGSLTDIKQKRNHMIDPRGIAATTEKIFVTDWHKNCVHVFDRLASKYLGSIGGDFLKQPAGIAVNNTKQLVVADQQNHCIWVLTQEGMNIGRPISCKGDKPGELNQPYGVAVNSQGMIVVSERENSRISVFNEQGEFVTCFGEKGSSKGQFNHPRHVCINSSDQVVVADEMNQRVQIFDLPLYNIN